MNEYLTALEQTLSAHANPEIAAQQKAYMKHQFDFYGIKTPERRSISKPFLDKQYLPSKEKAFDLVQILWQKPQREYQYFSMDLILLYQKQFAEQDLELFEHLVINGSWWDTVDIIAYKMVGPIFRLYPQHRYTYAQKWLDFGNIWLQRTAILFQLTYKDEMDTELLAHCIHSVVGSTEFFINKAIGWVLRTYSKTNPGWVIDFVNQTDLHSLSRKEALRLIAPL